MDKVQRELNMTAMPDRCLKELMTASGVHLEKKSTGKIFDLLRKLIVAILPVIIENRVSTFYLSHSDNQGYLDNPDKYFPLKDFHKITPTGTEISILLRLVITSQKLISSFISAADTIRSKLDNTYRKNLTLHDFEILILALRKIPEQPPPLLIGLAQRAAQCDSLKDVHYTKEAQKRPSREVSTKPKKQKISHGDA